MAAIQSRTSSIPPASERHLTTPTQVVWFRNNLRLDDNLVLLAAQKQAASAGEALLPVFCFDPAWFGNEDDSSSSGPHTAPLFTSEKTSSLRATFLIESVHDLRQGLRAIGSDLLIAYGAPADVIGSLGATAVHYQAEVTAEELKAERAVGRAGKKRGPSSSSFQTYAHWDGTMYHRDDLPQGCEPSAMPLTFTPWRNKVEKRAEVRAPLPPPKSLQPLPPNTELEALRSPHCSTAFMPTLDDLGFTGPAPVQDPKGVLHFAGGEAAARERLQGWMFDRDNLKVYFETRNGMLGPDYSTKFAPWLALGCLSPRRIYAECKRYESSTGIVNKSTYWVAFELVWRDFFRFMCAKVGDELFNVEGPVPRREAIWRDPRRDPDAAAAAAAWREGRTGMPLVDANMRELAATGFMSNRGRQNVASFLVLDLQLDWRVGAEHFEALLLDYDVCSNWGNWVAAAGLTGGRVNRFNIVKQTRDYDARGEYLKHWLPELAQVPPPLIYEPWKMSRSQQEQYGCVVGQDYPNIIPRPGAFSGGGGAGGGKGGGRPHGNKGGGSGREKGRGGRQGQQGQAQDGRKGKNSAQSKMKDRRKNARVQSSYM